MHIAIDVNDSSVASKILNYLSSFKNEISVASFESSSFDIEFEKNKNTLSRQIDDYKNGKAELIDEKQSHEEMSLFLSHLKEKYAHR